MVTGESSAARWSVPEAAPPRSDGARTDSEGRIRSGIMLLFEGFYGEGLRDLDRGRVSTGAAVLKDYIAPEVRGPSLTLEDGDQLVAFGVALVQQLLQRAIASNRLDLVRARRLLRFLPTEHVLSPIVKGPGHREG